MHNRVFTALLTSACAFAALHAPTACAQEATRDYDIAAQPLGAALRHYAAASGREIIAEASLVEGRHSASVRGRLSADAALTRLLTGTGLTIDIVDAWGGSLANRARFLLEIIDAVRTVAGHDFTLSVKLNSADFQRGGFSSADSIAVAASIADAGVDLIEISGGNYEQPRMMDMSGLHEADVEAVFAPHSEREAYFLDYGKQLLRRVICPIMVTGGFRTACAMRAALCEDGISLIGLARPMVLVPDAPQALLDGASALDRTADRLRLGRGIFGPASPIKTMRAINGFGALHWQYQQLRRLAHGHHQDRRLGLLRALIQEYRDQRRWMDRRDRSTIDSEGAH